MGHGIPSEVLAAEFRRQWPTEAELTELRLVTEMQRQELAERRQREATPDVDPGIAAAMAEVGYEPRA